MRTAATGPGHNTQPAIQDNGRVSGGDAYRLGCSYYFFFFIFFYASRTQTPPGAACRVSAGGGLECPPHCAEEKVVMRGDAQAAEQKQEGERMYDP